MKVPTVHFYTKKDCPLCEDAKDLLKLLQRELTFTLLELDIYADDRLLEQYGLMIPVVEVDGKIIQYGKIDIDDVRHVLA